MDERRHEPRARSLLGGKIVSDDRNCSMDCTIRNISAQGAMVVLSDAYRLPEEFDFAIPNREETHRATVTWRKGESAGLAFSPAEAAPARAEKPPRKARLQESLRPMSKGFSIGY